MTWFSPGHPPRTATRSTRQDRLPTFREEEHGESTGAGMALPSRLQCFNRKAEIRSPRGCGRVRSAALRAHHIRYIEYSYANIILVMPDSLRRFKADVFQALAHPTRIAILELLGKRELSAGELIGELGMEQANVSQHLAVLLSFLIGLCLG